MNVEVAIIGYNQPELLREAVESARRATCHELRFRLFLHSQHEGVMRVCEEQARHGDVLYFPYGTNRGVARSWNDGLLDGYAAGADVVLTVNDDVQFAEGDIDKIVTFVTGNRDAHVVFCEGTVAGKQHSLHWACFVLSSLALALVGYFDENFFPVAYEDVDYAVRARALGAAFHSVAGTATQHITLATRRSAELVQGLTLAELANREYFIRKWGRPWGGEDKGGWFPTPFNDPRLGFYIGPADRHAPYPGYNRSEAPNAVE